MPDWSVAQWIRRILLVLLLWTLFAIPFGLLAGRVLRDVSEEVERY